jgi:hypothetical protein
MHPQLSQTTLDERNVYVIAPAIFNISNGIYSASMNDLRAIFLKGIGPAFLRDFCMRAHASRYFLNVMVETPVRTQSLLRVDAEDLGT